MVFQPAIMQILKNPILEGFSVVIRTFRQYFKRIDKAVLAVSLHTCNYIHIRMYMVIIIYKIW